MLPCHSCHIYGTSWSKKVWGEGGFKIVLRGSKPQTRGSFFMGELDLLDTMVYTLYRVLLERSYFALRELSAGSYLTIPGQYSHFYTPYIV